MRLLSSLIPVFDQGDGTLEATAQLEIEDHDGSEVKQASMIVDDNSPFRDLKIEWTNPLTGGSNERYGYIRFRSSHVEAYWGVFPLEVVWPGGEIVDTLVFTGAKKPTGGLPANEPEKTPVVIPPPPPPPPVPPPLVDVTERLNQLEKRVKAIEDWQLWQGGDWK